MLTFPETAAGKMTSDDADDSFYLELFKNPIRFEPVSRVTNVFFDDSNRQVFAVRSGGATGVVVKGPDEKTTLNFRMEDRGEVISIKFSYDRKVLAIQRSQKSVVVVSSPNENFFHYCGHPHNPISAHTITAWMIEALAVRRYDSQQVLSFPWRHRFSNFVLRELVEFINFMEGADTVEYSQSCKGKSTKIIGFNWTNINEIVFVTDNGVEFYQVIPEKKQLKSLKSYSVGVNWFVWLPESAVLLLSTGLLGNIINPFHFRPGAMIKLAKFEVDLPVIPKPPKLCLYERDVTMANIYGQLYIVVLRHQPRGGGSMGAEIALYLLHKESPARKTDVLRLDMSGRFAINVVDNLVVVHHQASKTSMIFDIRLGGESDGYVVSHYPVLSPLPIKPFKLKLPVVPSPGAAADVQDYNCELYSPNWIVFQPNIVIDARLGCLWYVNIRLHPVITMMPDKCKLIEFLLQRRDSKMVILTVCQQMLTPGQQADLAVIAKVFDQLNLVYRNYQENEQLATMAEAGIARVEKPVKRPQAIIDQSDMYTHVFSVFVDNREIQYKFMVAVLLEYIRSLNQFQISVQHYLYELVINSLVQNNCFYQLHQFLQYHVLSDSKPLACLLLSLESVYPPAHQLALDMLKRLSTANEEIIEVLLSKQQLLPALRFIRSVGAIDTVSARKFLEAARCTEDDMLFYTVFKFFEQRNVRLRGNPKFPAGEHCEQHIKFFESTFGSEALGTIIST